MIFFWPQHFERSNVERGQRESVTEWFIRGERGKIDSNSKNPAGVWQIFGLLRILNMKYAGPAEQWWQSRNKRKNTTAQGSSPWIFPIQGQKLCESIIITKKIFALRLEMARRIDTLLLMVISRGSKGSSFCSGYSRRNWPGVYWL